MIIIQRAIFIGTYTGKKLSRFQESVLLRFTDNDDLYAEDTRIGKELGLDATSVAKCAASILSYFNVRTRQEARRLARVHGIICSLTESEVKILARLTKQNKEIASELCIGVRSVEKSLEVIFKKVNAKTRTEVILRTLQLGVIALAPFAGKRPTCHFSDKLVDTLTSLYLTTGKIQELYNHELTHRAIEGRINNLLEKLDAQNRMEAFIKGIQLGLIEVPIAAGTLQDLQEENAQLSA